MVDGHCTIKNGPHGESLVVVDADGTVVEEISVLDKCRVEALMDLFEWSIEAMACIVNCKEFKEELREHLRLAERIKRIFDSI